MNVKTKILSVLSLALSGAMMMATNTASAQTPVGGPLLQDLVPGSVLVYPKFDIRGDTVTQIRIVNNDSLPVEVKLNYICPGVKNVDQRCRALDRTVTFTPHQTRIIDVADQNPPCNQGYVVAYAQNPNTHLPASYNWLTGSYNITSGRRVEAENAIAIQSVTPQGTNLGIGTPLALRFGAGDYSGLPSNLFTDFRSVAYGTEGGVDVGSRITLLTLDVIAGAQNPAALANIDFWNAAEEPFSTSVEFVCWTELQLDSIDANFLQDNLGTTYGSMKITPVGNCPVPGLCPPMPLYNATMLGSIVEYGDGDVGGRLLSHDDLPKSTTFQPR